MDHEIQRPEFLFQRGEGLIHRGVVSDLRRHEHLDANRLAKGLNPPLHRFDIAERELRALSRQLAGDSPGDGVVVRHAHDQALLAFHEVALGQVQIVGHVCVFREF